MIETNKGNFETIFESIKNKGENKMSRLVKPAKVPSSKRNMSLDDYLIPIEI